MNDLQNNYGLNGIIIRWDANKKLFKWLHKCIGVNLNEIEKKIIELILNDPTLTALKISFFIEKSKRTVERYLKALQEKGYIERCDSDKKGYWKVIKSLSFYLLTKSNKFQERDILMEHRLVTYLHPNKGNQLPLT